MIGLVLLVAFGLYVIALFGVPLLLNKVCRSKFNAPRTGRWLGWASFLALFMAGFGITFVTWGVHGYYCGKDAGVTVYQTAEQWSKAHPNEWEEARPYKTADRTMIGNQEILKLSERFEWRISRGPVFSYPIVHRKLEQIIDRKTGDTQLGKRDYFIPGDHPGEFHFGFWWARNSCALDIDVDFEAKRLEFKNMGNKQ